MWPGTDASIPGGWTRKTSMDTRYWKGTAAAVNPDVTGGAATHTHTSPTHTHSIPGHTHTRSLGPSSGFEYGSGEYVVAECARNGHQHAAGTSGSVAGTSAAVSGTYQTANNDPSFFEMICIESDGSPPGIPDTAVALFNSGTPPTNWIQHVGSRNRFLKAPAGGGNGGGTGGGSHSHTADAHQHGAQNHTHSGATSGSSGVYIAGEDQNFVVAAPRHTHALTFAAAASGNGANATSASTAATTHEPTFHTLLAVENDKGIADLPNKIIAMWLGTLASIPGRWLLCDGASGTPDLRDRFIKAANVGGDVGTTGGTAGHDHTDPASHTHANSNHVHSVTSGLASGTVLSAGENAASADHTHASGNSSSDGGASGSGTQTVDSVANSEPLFRTVAYIQFQGAPGGAPIYF